MAEVVVRAPVYLVTWDDAFVDTHDFDEDEAKETVAVRRTSVGFLVAETEKGVILASDEYEKEEDGYHTRMFIPQGMIVAKLPL